MRVVKEINHSSFKITIFNWNQKYLIKFEQGDMEQTYKISELDIISTEDIDQIMNEEFFKDVQRTFNDMNKTFDRHTAHIL